MSKNLSKQVFFKENDSLPQCDEVFRKSVCSLHFFALLATWPHGAAFVLSSAALKSVLELGVVWIEWREKKTAHPKSPWSHPLMTWPDPSVNWSGSPRGMLESNSVPSSNLPYNVCRNRVKMAVEDLFFVCSMHLKLERRRTQWKKKF